MSYEVTFGNNFQTQFLTNNYPSYADDLQEESSNLTNLAKRTFYQIHISTGHQTALSDRVILCKSKSAGRDSDKSSDRKVEHEISVGGSLEKDSDGNTSSKADVKYQGSVKDNDSDKRAAWEVEADVEHSEKEGTSYKIETRGSIKF